MQLNDRPAAVYRCYDADDRLLYVGMSIDPLGRIAYHRLYAPWFPRMVRFTTQWFLDRQAARAGELAAIRDELPDHNMEGLTVPARALPGPDGTRWVTEALRLRRSGATIRDIARAIGESPGRVRSVLYLHRLV